VGGLISDKASDLISEITRSFGKRIKEAEVKFKVDGVDTLTILLRFRSPFFSLIITESSVLVEAKSLYTIEDLEEMLGIAKAIDGLRQKFISMKREEGGSGEGG
jgi:hypothetical protein